MKTYHPTNNLINQQTSTPSPLLMRQSRAWSQRNNAIPDTVHETLRAPGRPLDGETRQAMETHFGHDFSQVRIHADRLAAQSADAVDAHAYTVGHHIAFAAGQFAPHTTGGRKLLAHELAHTIQQGHAASALSLSIDAPNSAQERAAQSAEKGPVAITLQSGSGQRLARKEKKKKPPPQDRVRQADEVLAMKLDHRENGGLGRFDAMLFKDCNMLVQFRMDFEFKGDWAKESDKVDWRKRFVRTVQEAWSNKFALAPTGNCRFGCKKIMPYVKVYAPHSSPHVKVDVTHTDSAITSRAGYGVAHLDSLDLTPTRKKSSVEKMTPAAHEFGHLIGIDDKYKPGKKCAAGYPEQGIMCFGNTVTKGDYHPFANALKAATGCDYRVVSK